MFFVAKQVGKGNTLRPSPPKQGFCWCDSDISRQNSRASASLSTHVLTEKNLSAHVLTEKNLSTHILTEKQCNETSAPDKILITGLHISQNISDIFLKPKGGTQMNILQKMFVWIRKIKYFAYE